MSKLVDHLDTFECLGQSHLSSVRRSQFSSPRKTCAQYNQAPASVSCRASISILLGYCRIALAHQPPPAQAKLRHLDILDLDFRFRTAHCLTRWHITVQCPFKSAQYFALVSTHKFHRGRVRHTLMSVRYGLLDSTNNARLPF